MTMVPVGRTVALSMPPRLVGRREAFLMFPASIRTAWNCGARFPLRAASKINFPATHLALL